MVRATWRSALMPTTDPDPNDPGYAEWERSQAHVTEGENDLYRMWLEWLRIPVWIERNEA